MTVVSMDDEGRIVIPPSVRAALNLEPGDELAIEIEPDSGVLRVVQVNNPFDIMADYAIQEFEAGRTVSLRDYAARHGIAITSRTTDDDDDQRKGIT